MMDSEHPVEITDDEIARDIGRVVMAWSQLEMMLSSLLTVILGAQEGIARVIIAGKSFRQMADLLAALVDARAEPDRDGWTVPEDLPGLLKDWMKEAQPLSVERNTAAHGTWFVDRDGNWSSSDFTSRRSVKSIINDGITAERLPDLVRDIHASVAMLMRIQIIIQRSHPRYQAHRHMWDRSALAADNEDEQRP